MHYFVDDIIHMGYTFSNQNIVAKIDIDNPGLVDQTATSGYLVEFSLFSIT